jgi:hypothetical protein
MSAINERLKRIKNRMLGSSNADRIEAKRERAQKKTAAEAQRREHQRQDMDSKIHRK